MNLPRAMASANPARETPANICKTKFIFDALPTSPGKREKKILQNDSSLVKVTHLDRKNCVPLPQNMFGILQKEYDRQPPK